MAQTKRRAYFDDYKSIKDEIIEISEQRFENILTKRLKEFKTELMGELNNRFGSIDKRFESIDKRFENIDKKFDSLRTEIRWLVGLIFIIMTLLMTIYKFIG